MIRPAPPVFLQRLLMALLSARDRETISGDLLEAYAERQRTNGRFSADIRYARQVASLIPRAAFAAYRHTPTLVFICCFTALCGAWLGTMDILLRHRNLLQHESIAGLIAGQAFLTLIMLPLRRMASLRWAATVGGAAIAWLGGSALIALIRGDHSFEGYILIIAMLLVIQAALTWRVLFRRNSAIA